MTALIMPDLSTAVAESCLSFTDPSKKSDSNPLTEILKCPTKVVLLRVRIRPGAFLPASLGRNSLALTMGYNDSFRFCFVPGSVLHLHYQGSSFHQGPPALSSVSPHSHRPLSSSQYSFYGVWPPPWLWAAPDSLRCKPRLPTSLRVSLASSTFVLSSLDG